ncbi:hypothetical protein F5876DRAFT_68648 [Lentinula aff. lateritia]|uniref:Uncharacterized protein n=1 Tax=Lentinula aff. lateritia TaxID=2804960 RepID=A0ACC1TQI8_9AGAR|nr:hypothetical protein F5876DRAFT_68648 [Lentinula aff. lateritia]
MPKCKNNNISAYNSGYPPTNAGKRRKSTGIKRAKIDLKNKENSLPLSSTSIRSEVSILQNTPLPDHSNVTNSLLPCPNLSACMDNDLDLSAGASATTLPFPPLFSANLYKELLPLHTVSTMLAKIKHADTAKIAFSVAMKQVLDSEMCSESTASSFEMKNPLPIMSAPQSELDLENPERWNFGTAKYSTNMDAYPISYNTEYPIDIYYPPESRAPLREEPPDDPFFPSDGGSDCSLDDSADSEVSWSASSDAEEEEEEDFGELGDSELADLLADAQHPGSGSLLPIPDDYTEFAWCHRAPPNLDQAQVALKRLALILKPHRANGVGYKDPNLRLLVRSRLEWMQIFLTMYTSAQSRYVNCWTAASLDTAMAAQKGPSFARTLRKWAHDFVRHNITPVDELCKHSTALIDNDELATEIAAHLQSIGKFIKAKDIVDYLDDPSVRKKFNMKKGINLSTATAYLKRMGFRWKKAPGAYILANPSLLEQLPRNRIIVIWFHDESTFYANDQRQIIWVHNDDTAKPHAKGEGVSFMIADFVSADYGWLRSPDGTQTARVEFKAGKARDGYMTNEDITAQVKIAMDILSEHHSSEEHVFVYDNAKTHTKRADDALSATKMPKGPSKPEGEGPNFGGSRQKTENGILVYEKKVVKKKKTAEEKVKEKERKAKEKKTKKAKGNIPESTPPVPVDLPPTVPKEKLVVAREFSENAGSMTKNCSSMLNALSLSALLEQTVVVFDESCIANPILLRRNPILSIFVWGAAKRTYRMYENSTKEDVLINNVRMALDSVSLSTMRHFARRLNGVQAAWAAKRYRGHRMLPDWILAEFDKCMEAKGCT